jgi:hypothetical protein
MNSKDRIEYALSIKRWVERNYGASDDRLVEFLERIELKVAKQMTESDQVNRYSNRR